MKFHNTYPKIEGVFSMSDKVALPRDIDLPDWFEQIDGYSVWACKTLGIYDTHEVVAIGYRSASFEEFIQGFVKVYVLEDDGKPFPQMKGIWEAVSKSMNNDYFTIDKNGRICSIVNGLPPDASEVHAAVKSIMCIYNEWRSFPQVSDYATVRQLVSAMVAIESMLKEENHGYMKERIEKLRDSIKSETETIAAIEKEMNQIYERAADGMNLFEKHGIPIPTECVEDKKASDGELIRSNTLSLDFKGNANILLRPDGGIDVRKSWTDDTMGDIVIDKGNKMMAVFDGHDWDLIR